MKDGHLGQKKASDQKDGKWHFDLDSEQSELICAEPYWEA